MFDRALVTSGFDTETVVNEDYLTSIFLAQIEAGLLPLQLRVDDPVTGAPVADVTIHPPTDYERLYEPDPSAALPDPINGSFAVRLLADDAPAFMHVVVWVTVDAAGASFGPLPAGMFVDLELEAETGGDGFERNHALRLSLVGLDPTTAGALTSQGIDAAEVEAAIRAELDRSVPLGVARGQAVQQIRMRSFVTDEQRSLGLYVDLALRSGPEPSAYREARGDVSLAQDFRPPSSPVAFATSPELFGLLGPDAKFRQAEESEPGSGEYRFPLREDPLDRESDEIGRVKGISVGPEISVTGVTGRLLIDVHGEYTDALGDPDFHLQLLFDPTITDGVVEWDLDVDVDLGLLATLLLIAVGIGLTLLFGPGLGWGSTLLVGTITGVAVLKGLVAEPVAAKIIEDRLDDEAQASFLDALPFKVPAARRRWDPFYVTEHQVVALVDAVAVDFQGIAFEATGVALDKQPAPITSVVIRDEDRTAGTVTGLRYRVSDFQSIAADLDATGPGRDTLPYTRTDPVSEPTLVSVSDEQIAERIATKRLQAPLTYTAERIFLVDGQIDGLLCLSRRERAEQRQRVVNVWRASTEDQIRQSLGDAVRAVVAAELELELGRPPTEEELDRAFEARLDELVSAQQPGFEENELPARLEEAIAEVLRFDLLPEELIQRQELGALTLDGKEIIERRNDDGTRTRYYRDHPDSDRRDNLLSLPHYAPPYRPPA